MKLVLAVVMSFLFSISLIALDGGEIEGESSETSRWAEVDLTRYCGKTVGELITALGQDYEGYEFYAEHPPYLSSCWFTYEDMDMEIIPKTFEYCHRDSQLGPWRLEDFIKERIKYIKVRFLGQNGSNDAINPGDTIDNKGFSVNFPRYIGSTVGALLKAIPYPYELGSVLECGGPLMSDEERKAKGYCGCWFTFPYGVEIIIHFKDRVRHPLNKKDIIRKPEYFLEQDIGSMTVKLFCRGEKGLSNQKE
jgi:hypothetical protein